MVFNSTMYFITLKGYNFLWKQGIKVFEDLAAIKSKMAERFKSKYMKGKEAVKKGFPGPGSGTPDPGKKVTAPG